MAGTSIGQGKVVSALVELGIKKAGEFDVETLQKKIKKLPSRIEAGEITVPDDVSDETKDFIDLVTSAATSDEEIVIKAGKGKAVKGEKKPKGERKAPVFAKDDFGCRLGCDGNKINNALSKKPQTAEKIGELAGVTPGRVTSHCNYLIARGGGYEGSTSKMAKAEDGKFYISQKGEGGEVVKKKKKKEVSEAAA